MSEKRMRMEQARRTAEEAGMLEREMEHSRDLYQQAVTAFNQVSDPDLVEAWVFEMNAQQARYAYLLKRRKALDAKPEKEEDEVKT